MNLTATAENGRARIELKGTISKWRETEAEFTSKVEELIKSGVKDVHIYINSPGGSVTAGMAIYDTMQYIKPQVSTICIGMAASMGAFLLSSGQKGKRYALPNAEIMIHQPLGGVQGQAEDIKIHADRIIKIKENLNRIMAERCHKPLEQVMQDTERDNFMSAQEACDYGLIDRVIAHRE